MKKNWSTQWLLNKLLKSCYNFLSKNKTVSYSQNDIVVVDIHRITGIDVWIIFFTDNFLQTLQK